jgi:D-3-phosphoglycerate dehydrogenase
MTKVLIATDKPFAKVAVDGIRTIVEDAGFELKLLEKYTEKSQLLEAVADADALIVRSDKITAEVLEAAGNLKIVVRAGAGYDNIDLAAATAKKVVVMNTPGQNANAVAELVLGMMVYLARNQFDGKSGGELLGKKIGLLAYGAVGRNVARIAKGFGMEVFAYDPYIPAEAIEKEGVKAVDSVKTLFSQCQYVSLHIPATPETVGSINYDLLMSMPKKAVLVNAARGEVVNEADLVKVFGERTDFTYISDIAPANAAEIAEKFPGRFYFTPKKMGAQTEEANINAGLAAARQIRDFITKGVTTYQVNK